MQRVLEQGWTVQEASQAAGVSRHTTTSGFAASRPKASKACSTDHRGLTTTRRRFRNASADASSNFVDGAGRCGALRKTKAAVFRRSAAS